MRGGGRAGVAMDHHSLREIVLLIHEWQADWPLVPYCLLHVERGLYFPKDGVPVELEMSQQADKERVNIDK